MRRDFSRDDTPAGDFYRLLTATVVPRPIAWVSSRSAAGNDNLAPHSFFTVASVHPPIVAFTSVGRKDTLRNIEETGEFVVNFAPEPLFEQINATGTNFAREVSEFDAAHLTREPSRTVAAQRVLESPVALECTLHLVQPIGDSFVVFGEVSHAAIAEDVLEGTHPLMERLRPLSRLGRNEWGTTGQVQTINRIPVNEWPGHFRG
ncbi:flavin reductase family protein [Arthrobacter sp. TMN-50]